METQDLYAPYAPAENVLRVLGKARAGAIRGSVDVPYLIQLGIEQSMAPRAIRALRFLGFVNEDGSATPHLDDYIKASDEEATELLRQALLRSYGMILRAVDPTVDPRPKVFNAFRMMKPQGQWDRMVTLFLGLCRAAGMDVKDAPPIRPGRLDSPKDRGVARQRAKRETSQQSSFVRDLPPRYSGDALDPSLVAFLDKLRDMESVDALDAWYKTFRGLFEYVLSSRRMQQPLPLENDETQVSS